MDLWKARAKSKSAAGSGTTAATPAQAEQKKAASARNRKLATAPMKVQQNWKKICALKGRDRQKNKLKAEFTKILFADHNFEDAYWSAAVIDQYQWDKKTWGHWMLPSKADNDHGGGTVGKNAVDDAIAVGLYQ